jgi:hypothetical protein
MSLMSFHLQTSYQSLQKVSASKEMAQWLSSTHLAGALDAQTWTEQQLHEGSALPRPESTEEYTWWMRILIKDGFHPFKSQCYEIYIERDNESDMTKKKRERDQGIGGNMFILFGPWNDCWGAAGWDQRVTRNGRNRANQNHFGHYWLLVDAVVAVVTQGTRIVAKEAKGSKSQPPSHPIPLPPQTRRDFVLRTLLGLA